MKWARPLHRSDAVERGSTKFLATVRPGDALMLEHSASAMHDPLRHPLRDRAVAPAC